MEEQFEQYLRSLFNSPGGGVFNEIQDTRKKLILGSVLARDPDLINNKQNLIQTLLQEFEKESLPTGEPVASVTAQNRSVKPPARDPGTANSPLTLTIKRGESGAEILGKRFLFTPPPLLRAFESLIDNTRSTDAQQTEDNATIFSHSLLENYLTQTGVVVDKKTKIRYGLLLFKVLGYGKYKIESTSPWKIEITDSCFSGLFKHHFIKGYLTGIFLLSLKKKYNDHPPFTITGEFDKNFTVMEYGG